MRFSPTLLILLCYFSTALYAIVYFTVFINTVSEIVKNVSMPNLEDTPDTVQDILFTVSQCYIVSNSMAQRNPTAFNIQVCWTHMNKLLLIQDLPTILGIIPDSFKHILVYVQ